LKAIADSLRATIAFVAWQNFVDPRVWRLCLAWMAMLVLFVLVALAAGGLAAGRRRIYSSATGAFVLEATAGLAVLAVFLFFMALAGLYRPSAIIALAVVLLVLPAAVQHDIRAVRQPFVRLAAAVAESRWIVLLLLPWTVPALLPPIRWDEMSFHLAYADQWIRAGGLTLDPFMRFPLAPFNWQVLQGVALMAGSPTLPHLLSWLAGLLAALAVDLLLRRLDVRPDVRVAAVVAFVLTPLAQRYMSIGTIDMPMIGILAVSIYALVELRDHATPEPRAVVPAALCAALFAGMKVLSVAYVPLFLVLAALRLARHRQALGVYVGVMIAAGSLWYGRDVAISGDPAPPVFSHALGIDPMGWSASDLDAVRHEMATGLSWAPRDIVLLPLRMLRSTVDGPLRDAPMLGYVLVFPFTVLLTIPLWRKRMLEPLATAWFGVIVWVSTTYLIRYAVFLPMLVVTAAALLDAGISIAGIRSRAALMVIAAGLLIGPTPASIQYVKGSFSDRVPVTESESLAWERARARELASLDALTRTAPPPRCVYSLGVTQLKYYFQRAGYTVIGDYFHEGRYGDLRKALEAGTAREWLRGFQADVLVLAPGIASHELGFPEETVADEFSRRAGLPILDRETGYVVLDIPKNPK
jgi:hypothetical protein